jgi:hypothetical protein
MKCEDVGGVACDGELGWTVIDVACHESWMTWHEGMLSGGYEIRRSTGKMNLTRMD